MVIVLRFDSFAILIIIIIHISLIVQQTFYVKKTARIMTQHSLSPIPYHHTMIEILSDSPTFENSREKTRLIILPTRQNHRYSMPLAVGYAIDTVCHHSPTFDRKFD